jgi:hypothetical protein
MSTIKIKSTELVRKFADIKTLIQETGSRVVIEEYNRPVLVIYPCDEDGEVVSGELQKDMEEMEKLKRKLAKRRIKVSTVNFT